MTKTKSRASRPTARENAAAIAKLAYSVRLIITSAAATLREDVQPGYIRYRDRGVVVCAIMSHPDYVNVQFYFPAAPPASVPGSGSAPTPTAPAPNGSERSNVKRLETITLHKAEDIHPAEITRLLRQAMKRSAA